MSLNCEVCGVTMTAGKAASISINEFHKDSNYIYNLIFLLTNNFIQDNTEKLD